MRLASAAKSQGLRPAPAARLFSSGALSALRQHDLA